MPDHGPPWGRGPYPPGGFRPGRRPPWWPEDEPFPPRWRGGGRRFPRRLGLVVALVLGFFFVASGFAWRWYGGGGGFGPGAGGRGWSGPPFPLIILGLLFLVPVAISAGRAPTSRLYPRSRNAYAGWGITLYLLGLILASQVAAVTSVYAGSP